MVRVIEMRLPKLRRIKGLGHAIDILLGTLILWIILRKIGDNDPTWAIISFIIVSDPDLRAAWPNFISRLSNTLIGCTIGVISLFLFNANVWILPPVLAFTVLICTNLLKTPGNWKIAPVTSAIVITSALVEKSSIIGFEQSLRRAGEVLLGSVVALFISWVLSKFWKPPCCAIERK